MKQDENHIKVREEVKLLVETGFSDEEISKKLGLKVGARYKKKTVKWYKFCIAAKQNQKKALEKHGYSLYSKAGKIAQRKYPSLGHELGKNYGSLCGKKRMKQLRKSGTIKEYFSNMAKKLQQKDPEHSRRNMKKAHEKMKREGTFLKTCQKGAMRCKELYPNHFSKMGKRAHEMYPDLPHISRLARRNNSPYFFMGCGFDSNQEKKVCRMLKESNLIDKPVEGENVHFKINRRDIDFFIQNKIFLEFHPPLKYGRNKGETKEEYYLKRREILDKNGYENFSLVVISDFKTVKRVIEDLVTKLKN
ncbi:hypothetical protein KKG83_03415 [Candidatus Micrarchaeota archaeon]|nr:hypothetical protein [Candidatus Micrarchaeota archaeon]